MRTWVGSTPFLRRTANLETGACFLSPVTPKESCARKTKSTQEAHLPRATFDNFHYTSASGSTPTRMSLQVSSSFLPRDSPPSFPKSSSMTTQTGSGKKEGNALQLPTQQSQRRKKTKIWYRRLKKKRPRGCRDGMVGACAWRMIMYSCWEVFPFFSWFKKRFV